MITHPTEQKKCNDIVFFKDFAVIYIKYKNDCYNCLIDLEDVELLSQYYWQLKYDNRHPNLVGYVETHKGGKRTFIHRLLMNPPRGKVVDHINGNPLDNRKTNLRVCTQAENCKNQNSAKNIYYIKRDNLYTVQFSINRKPKYLCYTRDYEEAEKYAKLGRQLLLENRVDELLAMPCKCILHSYHRQSNV